MAINLESAEFLFASRSRSKIPFDRCLMLGCQSIAVSDREFAEFLRRKSAPLPANGTTASAAHLFRCLGASEVQSIDYSDYEGANLVHDLGEPIPAAWKGKFDLVFDGGTLEHVFNFPTAIRNCMEMIRVGGSFVAHTPANNWFGHGFYQFSPELFFRVFCEENGFQIEKLLAHETLPGSRWYEVVDPDTAKARGELITPFRVMLLIQARKIAEVPIFRSSPVQSDYAALWRQSPEESGDNVRDPSLGAIAMWAKTALAKSPALGRAIRLHFQAYFRRRWTFEDRRFFKRVDP